MSESLRQPCKDCPFRLHDASACAEDQFGFSDDDIDAWTSETEPWTCHMLDHRAPCVGAAEYREGHSPVTREDLERCWL